MSKDATSEDGNPCLGCRSQLATSYSISLSDFKFPNMFLPQTTLIFHKGSKKEGVRNLEPNKNKT